MILSVIAAYAKDKDGARVIGKNNQMPWHFPHDLERFKEYTVDNAIIMGRKTHEAIGRILPRRENIILTRQPGYKVDNAFVFDDLEEAINFASLRNSEAFIIGGQALYEQTICRADRLYLTSFKIPGVEGDTYFPDYDKSGFKLIHLEKANISGDCFRILERKYFNASQQAGSGASTVVVDSPPSVDMNSEVANTEDMAYYWGGGGFTI